MRIQLNGLIPETQYGFLTRESPGAAWNVSFQDTTIPISQDLNGLGRLQYRLIGMADGTAKVIRFSDIHRHSDHSLQDSILKVKDMVKHTEYSGALTNHGNMYGFLEYYLGMTKAGKKPILGFEGYMVDLDGSLERRHVIFLAKNNEGYRNLVKLTSEAFENFHGVPQVTWEMMEKYKEGIICLSACLAGIIPQALLEGDRIKASQAIERFISIYGTEDFYIEIQNHHIEQEDVVRPQLINLAKEYGLKYVATTDSHYLTEEDREAHQVVLCLRSQTTLNDPNKLSYDGEGYYLHDSEQMEQRFADYPEALDTSLDIADKCNVTLELDQVNLPKYDYPAPFANADEYMLHLAKEGFKSRFAGTPHLNDPVYINRFNYEADMIKQMGFSAYFVIVWDFIDFARKNNIPVGPGRGSAAGSMVAYCMGITDMDPIQYNLLFERFLNPERVSMPDVDTDIAHVGRPQVIQYMVDKYGQENVCRIITFGTFAAKQSVKDVARVLGYPASVGNKLSSMIKDPKSYPTLDDAIKNIPEFAHAYNSSQDYRRIIDLAKRIEGCKRHASLHACGLVVAPSRVSDYMPTCTLADKDTGERVVASQVEKEEVEKLSLIKMDLLGLKNLSAIDECLDSIVREYGKEHILDVIQSNSETVRFQDIPLGDRPTYEMLRDGITGAVFQMEGGGMTKVIQDMLSDLDSIPDDDLANVAFERLIAAVALYRPGPMDYIPEYVAGLRNPNKVHYDVPAEEPILSSTYGVMVYQEQLMQVTRVLAGYSMGQADVIRKACAKKKKSILAEEKEKFLHGNKATAKPGENIIIGCVANGIPEQTANEIWAKIEKFGEYAFNRSHAACYAWIGYITAYLSCHYPSEFYAAMLNAFLQDTDSNKAYLSQANSRGVELILPDIQKSECYFTAEPGKILFGLQGIAGVKKTAVAIIDERQENGPYVDLQDLYERLQDRGTKLNKKTIEGLVFSGALRSFSDNKAAILEQYQAVEKQSKKNIKQRAMAQLLLDEMEKRDAELEMENKDNVQMTLLPPEELRIPMPTSRPFEQQYELEKEFSVLGMYLSKHPTDFYQEQVLKDESYVALDELAQGLPDGKFYNTMGLVSDMRTFLTRNGDEMASCTLSTKFSTMSCVIFPKHFANFKEVLKDGIVVCVRAQLQEDNRDEDKLQLSIVDVSDPAIAFADGMDGIVVDVRDKRDQDIVMAFILSHPGYTRVSLRARGRLFPISQKVDGAEENIAYLHSVAAQN